MQGDFFLGKKPLGRINVLYINSGNAIASTSYSSSFGKSASSIVSLTGSTASLAGSIT
jgi:hypothetical protein